MRLDAMRAVSATPAGILLIEQIQALFESQRDELLHCTPKQIKYFQGSAAAYKRLLDGFKAARK